MNSITNHSTFFGSVIANKCLGCSEPLLKVECSLFDGNYFTEKDGMTSMLLFGWDEEVIEPVDKKIKIAAYQKIYRATHKPAIDAYLAENRTKINAGRRAWRKIHAKRVNYLKKICTDKRRDELNAVRRIWGKIHAKRVNYLKKICIDKRKAKLDEMKKESSNFRKK